MAAAAIRGSISRAMVLLLLVAVQTWVVQSQPRSCSSQLSTLNACAPFVVPGLPNATPNSDCCTALQAVENDCLCSTIRIASQLPTQCSLPEASCGGSQV